MIAALPLSVSAAGEYVPGNPRWSGYQNQVQWGRPAGAASGDSFEYEAQLLLGDDVVESKAVEIDTYLFFTNDVVTRPQEEYTIRVRARCPIGRTASVYPKSRDRPPQNLRWSKQRKSPERGSNGYSGRNARERINDVRKRTGGGHTMKPKRIISLLLAICLVAGLMPTVAFATESDKAIMLGTGNISGYDSTNGYDYIYFGNWTAQDTYTTSGPIKWRVLDDRTNTGETGLFLLSDGLLGTGYYGGVYFDNTSPYSNTWQGSDAQAWCNTFASSNLDSRELAAILETTKSDVVFTSSTYSVPFAASENILNGDKVFFLSAEEAENSAYGFANDNARIANYGGSACAWWLRSPYAGYTDGAGAVYGYGHVDFITVNGDWAARPAFNLDLTSVLFTSAAEGGKSASSMDSGLTAGERLYRQRVEADAIGRSPQRL